MGRGDGRGRRNQAHLRRNDSSLRHDGHRHLRLRIRVHVDLEGGLDGPAVHLRVDETDVLVEGEGLEGEGLVKIDGVVRDS